MELVFRDPKAIANAIQVPAAQILNAANMIAESQFNKVPFDGSWTAAQLVRHVVKSTAGMEQVLNKPGEKANRDAAEKVQGLSDVFLDFEKKLQSPEFIVPEDGPFDKKELLRDFDLNFKKIGEATMSANLDEIVEGLPFGPVTKLELLHFVLFHTMRHQHQLQKIVSSLSHQQAT